MDDIFENDPVVVLNLTDSEARSLLVMIEQGRQAIQAKLDSGHYKHDCQRTLATVIVARAEGFEAGIKGVLARTAGSLQ